MKRILTTLLILVGLMGLVSTANAQSNIIATTTSSAIADTRTTTFTITSATGWLASTFPGNLFYAYVDNEAMLIRAISGTTITVDRGVFSTAASPHKSGVVIVTGAAGSNNYLNNGQSFVTGGPFITANGANPALSGSCTRSNQATLPVVAVNTGVWYNCDGGTWLVATSPSAGATVTPNVTPLVGACSIPIGSVAYASIGTNSADVANKRMTTSIFVPRTFFSTGLQVLQGGTATTDRITVQLADASGKVIVSGAAAGTLLSGANTFASIPWALNRNGGTQTLTLIPGPALYFASIVGNGATAGAYQTVPTLTFKDVLSQGTTSITFGGFPDFTPPTTFTADLAPVVCLY